MVADAISMSTRTMPKRFSPRRTSPEVMTGVQTP